MRSLRTTREQPVNTPWGHHSVRRGYSAVQYLFSDGTFERISPRTTSQRPRQLRTEQGHLRWPVEIRSPVPEEDSATASFLCGLYNAAKQVRSTSALAGRRHREGVWCAPADYVIHRDDFVLIEQLPIEVSLTDRRSVVLLGWRRDDDADPVIAGPISLHSRPISPGGRGDTRPL